jgi:leucyl aminopeptidase
LDGLDVDTLVVLVTQDQRPLQGAAGLLDWRLCGYLSGLLVEHAATGRVGEYVLTHPFGRVPVTRVLLVGVGPQDTVNTSLKTVLPELARVVTEAGCRKVALATGCPVAVAMEALALSPVALRERVRVLFDETAA